MTRRMIFCLILSLWFGAVGCASRKKMGLTEEGMGVIMGLGVGGATGLVMSHYMKDPGTRTGRKLRSLNGVIIGTTIGGLGGYIVHHALKQRDERIRKETLMDLDFLSQEEPSKKEGGLEKKRNDPMRVQEDPQMAQIDNPPFALSPPEITRECFDWRVKGNRLIQNHCVWHTRGQSLWVPSMKKKSNLKPPNGRKE